MPELPPELVAGSKHNRMLDVLHDAHERSLLEAQLPAYLQAQRWFGGQSRAIYSVELERWVELGQSGACVCVIRVWDHIGAATEHLLVLTLGEVSYDRDQSLASSLPGWGELVQVLDATETSEVPAELLRLASSGGRLEGYRAELLSAPVSAEAVQCEGAARPIGAEQSNTSIVFGQSCILKLYRRLESGRNPELELTRYLTAERHFAGTPRLLALATLTAPDGYDADALSVQEFVTNEGDGWTWALSVARPALELVSGPAELRAWLEDERSTLEAAASLGRTTAQLHSALAMAGIEGMRPEPATREDIRAWYELLRREARETMDALGRVGYGAPDVLAAVQQAAELTVGELPDPGLKTRVHGDYHLGQVLRVPTGFIVIDFEGEPARSLAERRALQSPLVDVAGMLRSWSYAAYTAAREHGQDGRSSELGAAWEAAVQERFLEAYWQEAAQAPRPFLPESALSRGMLLALFALRKALYEVRYELNYRPDWVEIPASAVRSLVKDLSQ